MEKKYEKEGQIFRYAFVYLYGTEFRLVSTKNPPFAGQFRLPETAIFIDNTSPAMLSAEE